MLGCFTLQRDRGVDGSSQFAQEHRISSSLNTHILRMMISFLAAFRTFRPSRFRNFLQVYNFPVVFSLARKISQNSSLQGYPQTSPHSWGPLRLGCLGGSWAHQHSPRSQ